MEMDQPGVDFNCRENSMKPYRAVRYASLALGLTLLVGQGFARAQPAKEYQPSVGQEGKDVVWVPTPQALVDKMLDMAKVTPRDYVIDLGSGDGRTVITAAKRGARAHGIEYNPEMVELSKRNAEKEGVADKATFAKADLFESDFSQAQVITMFLLPSINLKLRPKILDLKPGTRIVSNSFDMEEWKADATATASGCEDWCTAHLWIVPAKVGGTWKLPQGELNLKQTFQMLSGALKSGKISTPITGKVTGDQITFTAGNTHYTGRVNGNSMEGTAKGGSGGKWSASRVGS
jgi:precorrin-6B methylase 2